MSSSATWEEIKRLAADFQRVQLVESTNKLTERNCIEIINKLIELSMIDVIHSIDGKEFITKKQLEKEIYDELYIHEGRINTVMLQTLLNVDISHIETKVNEIIKHDANLVLILGQIISKDYMNKISEEINELLQEKESVSISELTNAYELPADFIQKVVKPRIGTIIKGEFDGKILYTHSYVNNQKAVLAGVLEATIKPIRFVHIIKEFNLDTQMVFKIYDELIASGQISGTLFGGRQEMSAVFVPTIYTHAQEQYTEAFFKQNGYIDFSSLRKIGITEPDAYVRTLFQKQECKYLSSSCFTSYYLESIEAEAEELLNKTGFCDLSQLLPSVLNDKDLAELTAYFANKLKATVDTLIMADTHVVNRSFLRTLQAKFQAKMEQSAVEDLKRSNFVLAIKAEHVTIGNLEGESSKAATTSSKSAKGKGKKGKEEASSSSAPAADESLVEVVFMDKQSLAKELQLMFSECPDELAGSLVDHFLRPLNVQYLELLKNKVEQGLIFSSPHKSSSNSDEASTAAQSPTTAKKLSIKDVQEKVKMFLVSARIFDKSLKLFADAKVQDVLSKHLARGVCAEVTNDMLRFIATEQLVALSESSSAAETLNSDSRMKIIQKLKEPNKQRFSELNQALTNKTSTEIIDLVEKIAIDSLELSMKKADSKREKELLLQMRESTKSSLEKETDAATVLQLVGILLFCQANGGLMLNAPGRSVPSVLEHLRADLIDETYQKLIAFQNLIIENVSRAKADESAKSDHLTPPLADADQLAHIKSIGFEAKAHLKAKK